MRRFQIMPWTIAAFFAAPWLYAAILWASAPFPRPFVDCLLVAFLDTVQFLGM